MFHHPDFSNVNRVQIKVSPNPPHPDQQLHNDRVSLGSGHVQRGPVHFGAGVSADAGSEQDVGGGVMSVLSSQVEGGRPQLQDTQTGIIFTAETVRIHPEPESPPQ